MMEFPQNLNSLGSDLERVDDKPGPTTSNPVNSSHNMNDLKMLDFNSADEVRQAMKVMLAGKMPLNSGDELSIQPTQVKEFNPKGPPGDEASVKSDQEDNKTILDSNVHNMTNAVLKMFTVNDHLRNFGNIRRKRPGRPPKAGPSKRFKRPSVTVLYIGKLSNVVEFKQCNSGSESDDYFY